MSTHPRPWRVVRRGAIYAHIQDATGEKVVETGATDHGLEVLRKLCELANRYPIATSEQLSAAALQDCL